MCCFKCCNVSGGFKSKMLLLTVFAHEYDSKSRTNNCKVSVIHASYLTYLAQSFMNIIAGGAQKSVDLETTSSPIGHMTD